MPFKMKYDKSSFPFKSVAKETDKGDKDKQKNCAIKDSKL